MAAILFGLLVLGSLFTSALIYFDVIAGSPLFLTLAVVIHIVVAIFFFRGYRHYQALHRLVSQNQGALFMVAVSNMIHSTRIRALRDHYRLRKCQGLVHAGEPLEALRAVGEFRKTVKANRTESLDILAAEGEANLQLGELKWSERALERARKLRGFEKHPGLMAVEARLRAERGETEEAIRKLTGLQRVRQFPLTRVVRARNQLWLGQALARSGRTAEAGRARDKAISIAPKSYYAQRAARPF